MDHLHKSGIVIFASAGPGDPDLITLKAANYLKQADVVLVDRLVSQEILNTHVNEKALIINVGKQCRRGISTNDVDVFANDIGLIAIIENNHLLGFNVAIGGGLSTTHGNTETYPRLDKLFGEFKNERIGQEKFGDYTFRKYDHD